jgi:hypothetical protein
MKFILNIAVVLVLILGACKKDFLNVSEELAQEQTLEKIFSNPQEVRRWHRTIYTGVPNTMNFHWITLVNGLGNPWTNMSDELVAIHRDRYPYTRNVDPTDNGVLGRWELYKLIRQANVFLERAQEIPFSGGADYVSASEVESLKNQARFFRAYYHYLLFELYGPVPIVKNLIDPGASNIDFARNSVDEVVDFIYSELTEVAPKLDNPQISIPDYLAVPTRGTALAVRARLLVYAASPLFNGGYVEAVALRDKEGKQLFPNHNSQKWNRALAALQEFIDYANSGHYELHKEYTAGQLDPDKSLYELHMKYNKETIFARSDDDKVISNVGGVVGNIDRYLLPRGARSGTVNTGGSGVLQELIDDFQMNDGLSITESPLYTENGYSVAGDDLTGRTTVGTQKMFINREPRFYQTVFYNGRKWHVGGETIWFNRGGNSDNSGITPFSGHLIYKRVSRRVYHQSPHPSTEYRPVIIHRLAEFYLLYAEALNEVDPSDIRIIQYVDKVRERAGIPLLMQIKANIIGNQQLQREAIRQEMRIELATEGQRYFDVKRWMIAQNAPDKGGLGGDFYGMDMFASTLDGFYTRKVIQKRVFEKRGYLFPLPQDEVQISRKLIQNPGY